MKRERPIGENLRAGLGFILLGWVLNILPRRDAEELSLYLAAYFKKVEPDHFVRAAEKDRRHG